jgi:hypothetical protein
MVGLRFPQAMVLMVPGAILLLERVLKAVSLAFFGQL